MLRDDFYDDNKLTVSDWKELVHVYNTQVQLLTEQNDILREEVVELRNQVKILEAHYNFMADVANSLVTVINKAGCLLDRVENYIPVLAVGKKMSEHPGRTPKVSDDTLLSLSDQGLGISDIAEEVGLSISTVSVRLKKLREA